MPIVVPLDILMARKKIRLRELSERVGITEVNLSRLKNGHLCAIRIETLDALCRELECIPGDLLEYETTNPSVGNDEKN